MVIAYQQLIGETVISKLLFLVSTTLIEEVLSLLRDVSLGHKVKV